jgi:hypothetical protein
MYTPPVIPPVVVYKIEQAPEPILIKEVKPAPVPVIAEVNEMAKIKEPEIKLTVPEVRAKSPTPEFKKREAESPRVEKRKHQERKKDIRVEPEVKEFKRKERSAEIERKKERDIERERKRQRVKEELESEVISLVDNTDELIDLTGDQSDSKGMFFFCKFSLYRYIVFYRYCIQYIILFLKFILKYTCLTF